MQESDENENLDTLNAELEKCLEQMKKIVDEAQQSQALKAEIVAQPDHGVVSPDVFLQQVTQTRKSSDSETSPVRNYFQRKKNLTTTIGLRARLRGEKTPSPKKRISETESSDSPNRFVYWQSPAKPTLEQLHKKNRKSPQNLQEKFDAEPAEDAAKNKAAEITISQIKSIDFELPDNLFLESPFAEAPQAEENISKIRPSELFSLESQMVSPSSPSSVYPRGHSPSHNKQKSRKSDRRILSGPDKPDSLLGESSAFNWSQSLGLGSIPAPKINSPIKESSPKTQILQSQPKHELDPLEKANFLHKQLTELNNQYKKIIGEEYRQITTLLKHSRALLPQNLNLDAQGSSLSYWMSNELFNLLSLSCLRQITSLITRTYIGLEALQHKLKTLDILQSEDVQLVSIYKQLTVSIDNAIKEDIQFLKSASNSLKIYEMQSKYFTKYFENTENESQVINQLYELIKNCTEISVSYLEENPTLVRRMVEESFQFIKRIPVTTTHLQYCSTIFPELISNLVSLTSKYQIEKNNNQQVAQFVF